MKRTWTFLKNEPMLLVSLFVCILSLFFSKPSLNMLTSIDWKTLAILFMLLSVLHGFKQENLFLPILRFSKSIKTLMGLCFFLTFGVFFTSMFVTNDVSLIIFVPLSIILFRSIKREEYIIPILVMENIAAVRGSLLTPFGSPQNLFLFSNSGISFVDFLLMMLPLWIGSMFLLSLFLFVINRLLSKEKQTRQINEDILTTEWDKARRGKRILFFGLFLLVIFCIVSRTPYWPYITLFVTILLLLFDRKVFLKVDYVLLLTFLCFFVFSSSIVSNESISTFLHKSVTRNEYWWSIGISQIISNVPASIVLWPFTESLKPLIYGLDTAGLVTIIGSLASVINLRLYTKEYPKKGKQFILCFETISLCFFAIVCTLQLFLL